MIQLIWFHMIEDANEWLRDNKDKEIFNITSSYCDKSLLDQEFKVVIAYYAD